MSLLQNSRRILASTALAAGLLALAAPLPAQAQPAHLDAVTQGFVNAVTAAGGPPIYTLSPQAARQVLSGAQAGPVARLPAEIRDLSLPTGPLGSVNVRIVRPEGVAEALPVVMYFHGGGWMLGGKDTHDRLIREIAVGARVAVIFVDYRNTPDVQYPVPNEEAYAATKYVVENARVLNVDASRLAVAGDSAGGNMAAAVTLLAKQRGGPKISHQVLFYPVTDDISLNASYAAFGNGPWLTTNAMHFFLDAYLPKTARNEVLAFPLKASVDQLRGLPEATVIVAENDLLRDEGEAYARKLIEAGVSVTSTRYNGAIHDFVMLNGLAESPATVAAIAQANAALRRALQVK
ncbi:MAG: alpha/beta hydrolase fold domain-containing protein [Ferrovibrio sp.]|jgi:acetyl esterase|uniref:alpha/beta hydrolase fold domain-containing protein n=1 Tax=Ferrovibrio sp. TaxID=1917215 RepID=UPI00391988E6